MSDIVPPCDCVELVNGKYTHRCYCSNRDDGERSSAWCVEANYKAAADYDKCTIEFLRKEAAEAAARIEQLEKVLWDIAELNVPRPVGHTFREDGVASKHDKCWHGEYMYDECGPCLAAHARAALEAKP